jgi:hypothetical protein
VEKVVDASLWTCEVITKKAALCLEGISFLFKQAESACLNQLVWVYESAIECHHCVEKVYYTALIALEIEVPIYLKIETLKEFDTFPIKVDATSSTATIDYSWLIDPEHLHNFLIKNPECFWELNQYTFLRSTLGQLPLSSDLFISILSFESPNVDDSEKKAMCERIVSHLSYETIIEILGKDGSLIQYMPLSIHENYNCVLAAIKKNGTAIKWIQSSLKNHEEILKTAISQNAMKISRLLSPEQKQNVRIVLHALLLNQFCSFCFPEEITKNPAFIELFQIAQSPKDEVKIGNTFYIANPIPNDFSEELMIDHEIGDGSYEELLRVDLKEFVENWTLENKPEDLEATTEEMLQEKKAEYLRTLEEKFTIIQEQRPFFGTQSDEADLEVYFTHIKLLLSKIHGAIKDKPDFIAERMSILEGLSVCSGGLQARLFQLESDLITYKDLSFGASLAKLIQKSALRSAYAVQQLRTDENATDSHYYNRILYHLHPYLGGKRVPFDHLLAGRFNEETVQSKFLNFHTPKRIAESILDAIKEDESLFEQFITYIREEFFKGRIEDPKALEAYEQSTIEFEQNLLELKSLQDLLPKDLSKEETIHFLKRFRSASTKEELQSQYKNCYLLLEKIAHELSLPLADVLSMDSTELSASYAMLKEEKIQEFLIEEFEKNYLNGYPDVESVQKVLIQLNFLKEAEWAHYLC